MSRIVWDKDGERLYETGVKNGVLYVKSSTGYAAGVPWNGLTAVTESPSGAEATALYADDTKYLNLISKEELGGTIEAYTYPEEFAECDGSKDVVAGMRIGQQPRKAFGFCYRTALGNDEEADAYGYKLHIIYNAKATASERAYASINDSPEAITFSWEFSTTKEKFMIDGKEYETSCITIDSTKFTEANASKLKALEDKLYGTDGDGGSATDPTLPSPAEVYNLLKTGA